jgi:hypothetical protein
MQVKPEIFNKMGPCMLDERVAVCLAPQCFHNLIYPDGLDAANGDFMFGRLPYFFGAGVLFVTGARFAVVLFSSFSSFTLSPVQLFSCRYDNEKPINLLTVKSDD